MDRLALVANGAFGGLFELEQHLGSGALAASGLANDAQGFAGADLERDPIHRFDVAGYFGNQQSLGDREVFFEAFRFEQNLVGSIRRWPGIHSGSGHSSLQHAA